MPTTDKVVLLFFNLSLERAVITTASKQKLNKQSCTGHKVPPFLISTVSPAIATSSAGGSSSNIVGISNAFI